MVGEKGWKKNANRKGFILEQMLKERKRRGADD
jgi:hypothetical protein